MNDSQDKIVTKLKNFFSDTMVNTRRLFSETEYFLSQANLYSDYESEMIKLRNKLDSSKKSGSEKIIKEVHSQLVEIRKKLRLQGYDVSLGKHRLIFDGFRNDDSLGEGFKRVALYILNDYFLWLAGSVNHIELDEILEQQITRHCRATGKKINIQAKHYLWYKRTKDTLILSGSVTERQEDYRRLKALGEKSSLLFLSKLKDLN